MGGGRGSALLKIRERCRTLAAMALITRELFSRCIRFGGRLYVYAGTPIQAMQAIQARPSPRVSPIFRTVDFINLIKKRFQRDPEEIGPSLSAPDRIAEASLYHGACVPRYLSPLFFVSLSLSLSPSAAQLPGHGRGPYLLPPRCAKL